MKKIVSKIVLQLFFPILALSQDKPTICLEQGACFVGSWIESTTSTSNKFASFQGIRYAQPPTGELRFTFPQPYVYEDEVIDVTQEFNITCPQLGGGDLGTGDTPIGEEDCLMLNIYVPEVIFNDPVPDTKLPVMIFIHGGGLTVGSNNYKQYGPMHFMDRGVVLVIPNYRLGPLGFLSLGTPDVPGNFGTKLQSFFTFFGLLASLSLLTGFRDQNMAMKWVQDNIALFGGDPTSVTLFGESAGSTSVAMQILSYQSSGLFHRAILESGTVLSPSWGNVMPMERGIHFGELMARGRDVTAILTL